MSWTDERVELLRKLWLDGRSASQIAAELANGISRNAVIGKVHRLGLSSRTKAPSAAPQRQRPRPVVQRSSVARSPSAFIRGATALAVDLRPVAAPLPEPIEEVVVPLAECVTIMELRESMCRWPIGDPVSAEFRFCGSKASPGASYCAHHSRLAYQPAQDRRRERDRERRLQRIV
jgi:GcrA cell cycle regulator